MKRMRVILAMEKSVTRYHHDQKRQSRGGKKRRLPCVKRGKMIDANSSFVFPAVVHVLMFDGIISGLVIERIWMGCSGRRAKRSPLGQNADAVARSLSTTSYEVSLMFTSFFR